MFSYELALLISKQRHRDMIAGVELRRMDNAAHHTENRPAGKSPGAVLRALVALWF
jgi:hypothetical protein